MIALYRAIRVIYLHNVSIIVIREESAYHDEEEDYLTTTWHVGCPYPHKLLHILGIQLSNGYTVDGFSHKHRNYSGGGKVL